MALYELAESREFVPVYFQLRLALFRPSVCQLKIRESGDLKPAANEMRQRGLQ